VRGERSAEAAIARGAGESPGGKTHHLQVGGRLAVPFQYVHPHPVAAGLAGARNAQKIPLQAAVGKVFV